MNSNAIVIYDGICNLCNYWVNLIIKNDKMKVFRFVTLQSEQGKKLIEEYGIQFNAQMPESVALIYNRKVFLQSGAVLRAAKMLGGKWQCIYFFLKIIPEFLRNYMYNLIARNRYKWFGTSPECLVP